MNELHQVLVPPRGLFAAGKFDQYQARHSLFHVGAGVFRAWSVRCLAKSDVELGPWREALGGALGPNGQLMVDLVPELTLIIGEQAPVPSCHHRTRNDAFNGCSGASWRYSPNSEHPLALFLDNLQWLDAATLDLLEDLLMHPDVRHVLLIGAYEDDE